MAFEARLFGKTRFGKYQHCLKLIEANAKFAPLWERICLAIYIGIGPTLAKLFSESSIECARCLAAHKQVASRADFRTGNIASLPYMDESLDLIVASEIIEHMPEAETVVGEIARVLRRQRFGQ